MGTGMRPLWKTMVLLILSWVDTAMATGAWDDHGRSGAQRLPDQLRRSPLLDEEPSQSRSSTGPDHDEFNHSELRDTERAADDAAALVVVPSKRIKKRGHERDQDGRPKRCKQKEPPPKPGSLQHLFPLAHATYQARHCFLGPNAGLLQPPADQATPMEALHPGGDLGKEQKESKRCGIPTKRQPHFGYDCHSAPVLLEEVKRRKLRGSQSQQANGIGHAGHAQTCLAEGISNPG